MPIFTQASSPVPGVQTSHASSASEINWNGRALSSESEDLDFGGGPGSLSRSKPTYGSIPSNAPLCAPEVRGKVHCKTGLIYFYYIERHP